MHHVRNAVHHDFQRNRDLLFDLLRGNSRPLGDDLHVVVRHVRISFDRQLVKGNRAPAKQQQCRRQDQETVFQGEIDKLCESCVVSPLLRHSLSAVFCSTSAFVTTCLPGLQTRKDFLHLFGQRISARDFHAAESVVVRRHVHPVAVVQVQNCRRPESPRAFPRSIRERWRWRTCPRASTPDCALRCAPWRCEWSDPESAPMLLMRPCQRSIGVGIQPDVGAFAQLHVRQIVFVNVADHPNCRQIRNRERIGAERLDAGGVGHLLVGDHARNRRVRCLPLRLAVSGSLPSRRRCSAAVSTSTLSLIFGILGDLKVVHRDRAVGEQILRAIELRARQRFVGHRLAVVGIAGGNVIAANGQQHLAFSHRVPQARMNVHHASGGQA